MSKLSNKSQESLKTKPKPQIKKQKKEKDSKNFIKQEIKSVKQYLNKLKIPTEKEYAGLLRANFVGICGLGLLGYSIKFIHVMMNNMLMGEEK